MSTFKGSVKEGAGYLKEETGEALNDKKMANEGRSLRNEGRIEDGKAPKTTVPGEEEKEEKEKSHRVL